MDDEQLISMWLHGKSENTQEAYFRDAMSFSEFVDVPFPSVTLAHVQAFDLSMAHLKPATRARKLASVKSLLAFGHRIGYLATNAGSPLRAPRSKDTLSERILNEEDVLRLISRTPSLRNKLILAVLYYGGLRVSELCSLKWRDLAALRGGLQLTIHGKGGYTRAIVLPRYIGEELMALNRSAGPEEPVFASSRTGRELHRSQVFRIVREAARRSGLSKNVSPHWLRHAHASHALDNGAPTHLVQRTLGHKSLATTGRYAHARPKDSSARFIRPPK